MEEGKIREGEIKRRERREDLRKEGRKEDACEVE